MSELSQKPLQFQLWEDPPLPREFFTPKSFNALRRLHGMLTRMLRPLALGLVKYRKQTQDDCKTGNFRPGHGHTLPGKARSDNVQFAFETLMKKATPGYYIEIGVWGRFVHAAASHSGSSGDQ